MLDTVFRILNNCVDPAINDATIEGDAIILTIDDGDEYRAVRIDVTDLGDDGLEHD